MIFVLQRKHSEELQMGLLLVIRMPKTDFLFQDKSVKRTYNDSLMRVQWRSKQNLDYAALIEFCANLSTYYLHLEDDVIAADAYLRHIRDFISANALKTWAMLEVCPHGFIGKLFKTKDLPKLVMILRAFYLEQPCDFLIKPYFINLMTQAKAHSPQAFALLPQRTFLFLETRDEEGGYRTLESRRVQGTHRHESDQDSQEPASYLVHVHVSVQHQRGSQRLRTSEHEVFLGSGRQRGSVRQRRVRRAAEA